MIRALRLAALAAILTLPAPASARAVPEEEIPAGTRGVVRTVLAGRDIEEIPLTFLGRLRGAVGPGRDLYLVRLEGPAARRVGVAAGMSGSPVYVGERIVGALSYRMGNLPTEAVAGVTPMKDLLDAAVSLPPSSTGNQAAIAPIATPLFAGGVMPAVRERLLRSWFERRGFVVEPGGGTTLENTGGQALRPGSPIAVELVRGDLEIAAVGTVTWVDGSRVYAFGHPFLGAGRVALPLAGAKIVHTLGALGGSVKLSNVGRAVGVLHDDRLTGVVGELGKSAPVIPVSLRLRGGDYREHTYRFEIARQPDLTPTLTAVVVANTLLQNTGHDDRITLRGTGRVRLRGMPDLPLEMSYAAGGAVPPAIQAALDVQETLSALYRNPFRDPPVRSVSFEVRIEPGIAGYRLESVQYDHGPVRPGRPLRLRCVLRAYRGATRTEILDLAVPRGIRPTASLTVAVGSREQVDRIRGWSRRGTLAGVRDLAGLVRILGRSRGSDLLSAVLLQPAPGVIVDGRPFAGLPPTAAHLLSAAERGHGAGRLRNVTLSVAEQRLDGPVQGSVTFPLTPGPEIETGEER